MKIHLWIPILAALWSAGPANSNEAESTPRNILILCIDDLRPELACFGKPYIKSPHIDALATRGVCFQRHYVNSPSCGPSRYTLLTGRYGPSPNQALFERAQRLKEAPETVFPSMPEWFRNRGYTTVSIGKVSHHPGGWGGEDWDDPNQIEIPNAWDRQRMPTGKWQSPRGAMHGLSHGETRTDSSKMSVFQSTEGPDNIYPDGLITEEALRQLDLLADDPSKPFFLAVGLIRPHLPFGAPAKYFDLYRDAQIPPIAHPEKPTGSTTWHGSGEFMQYNRWEKDPRDDSEFADEVRRHYAACVSYADAQVGRILAKLKQTGADENTVILLWGDHGWHLGEHAIWGKHSLFEESLRSPLIVVAPQMGHRGVSTSAVVETADLFPTLCDLTSLDKPNFVHGKSLLPLLKQPDDVGHTAVAYRGSVGSLRTSRFRFNEHANGDTELYDHDSPLGESLNVADQYPEVIRDLSTQLQAKLSLRD
ncbi:sulfatase [Novipirellula artificiosorum]|uniref:Arylsulfatase n=1 Tax=Novipirellula artificiosorum TaxID=2528016 RepID=A0A5C6DGD9_9BACT|nr:sulfatase [Novipirellula artificiosorum]TWU35044.1 Arylsulfatase [Novipirellula artificiosorum]